MLGLNNIKTFQRHNRKVHQACQSVADTSLDTATEVLCGAFGDLMDDAGVIDRPGKQPTLLATKTLMGLRRRWKLRQRDEYGPLEKYAFRYTTILSDGDASTFAALTQLEPYGPDHVIVKLDCLNHAEKRMDTGTVEGVKAGWTR